MQGKILFINWILSFQLIRSTVCPSCWKLCFFALWGQSQSTSNPSIIKVVARHTFVLAGLFPRLLTLQGMFWFPGYRDFFLSTGACAATKKGMESLLRLIFIPSSSPFAFPLIKFPFHHICS